MHERREASVPHFHVSRQGAHFSAHIFLAVLHLALLPGPPPGAASAVPASSRGGVCEIETQALSPRWHHLLTTALSLSKRTFAAL